MKKMINRYRISKFKRFSNGLLFAMISVVCLILCVIDIPKQTTLQADILLPFIIAVISMLLGFISIFHEEEAPKQKV